MEKKIKDQDKNLIQITKQSSNKEALLSKSILDYQKQIQKLQTEVDLSHTTISNLTEEKEKSELNIHAMQIENIKLKKLNEEAIDDKNKIEKRLKDITHQLSDTNSKNEPDAKKFEDQIKSLKRTLANLSQEKKELESVIIKQEEAVIQLTKQTDGFTNALKDKDLELQSNIEYAAKLNMILNANKKEIQKLKQSSINQEQLTNLQFEVEKLKKEIEVKNNKINQLAMTNKILQNKLLKQSQFTSMTNEINGRKSNNQLNEILQSDNRNKIVLGKIKPHSQQEHKTLNKRVLIANNRKSSHFVNINSERKNEKVYLVKKEEKKQKEEDNISQNLKGEKIVIIAKQKQLQKKESDFDIEHFPDFDSNIKLKDSHNIDEIKNIILKPIKDNSPQINSSLEMEFPIIESYCELNPKSNYNGCNKGNIKQEVEEEEEDNADTNEVAKLQSCMNKILKEF